MPYLADLGTAWEAICNRCGKCCYVKFINPNGTISQSNIPCQYLDTKTRLCKVYNRRFEVNPDCLAITADLIRMPGFLPDDCPYKRLLEPVRVGSYIVRIL